MPFKDPEKLKAYKKSKRYRLSLRIWQKKYRQSAKGKAAEKRYEESSKRKNLRRKYEKSIKYVAKQKQYKNSFEGKLRRNTHERERRKIDIQFKLSFNLRNRLRQLIKTNQKTGSAIKDLGCSVGQLKLHLESQFLPGMTWENYGNKEGQWSIDHIMPLSKVDLTNRDELIKVCHYTNLRPLWHIDNIRKSNKI